MRHCLFTLVFFALSCSTPTWADASLDTRLGLDAGQSRQLAAIEATYRRDFASLRQEYNRQSRALRRARIANDSDEIARLGSVTESLGTQLAVMREDQDRRIAGLLRVDQQSKFAAYRKERQQMLGSSRDERLLD